MTECITRACRPLPYKRQRYSHCTVCHCDFKSHKVGDAHRIGSSEPHERRCLADDEMTRRGWVRDADGWWGENHPHLVSGGATEPPGLVSESTP